VVGVEQLASVPLFGSLTHDQREELAKWFDAREAGEGVRLTGEGAPGYSFFVLTEGTASVTFEGESVAALGPGDFFGEMAIIGGGRRKATVTASSPAKLLVMFGTEFRRLEATHPDLASVIEGTMAKRLTELGD
jgi:CRP-like cAMP-binding protein